MLPKSKYKQYQDNPLLWRKEVLDDYPRWHKQDEILLSVRDNRNTYVKACHGVGKTFTAKDVVLWFLMCHYPSKVITTAPSWVQVEKLLWSEINTAVKNAKVPLGGQCKKVELFLRDDWFALGVSPKIDTDDDGKRLTGFHSENVLVIFDEAPAVNPKLWEIKETLMTSKNVRFLGIGNPVENTGAFYEGFTDENVHSISMDIFDTPNFVQNNVTKLEDLQKILSWDIDKRETFYDKLKFPFPHLTNIRWAVERLEKWGGDSPLFKSRVLSMFPEMSSDTIISLSSLERCKEAKNNTDNIQYLGVDVARFGSDDTCIYHYKGGTKIDKLKFNGQDTVKTANVIKNKILSEGIRVVTIDDTGLGGGVTDQVSDFLSESGIPCKLIPVNFAEASTAEEYDGIVTDMFYHAKQLIEDQYIQCVDEGGLFAELTDRRYKFTNKGKIKVESKDDYKKRTGKRSPDDGDAFLLTLWGMGHKFDEEDFYNVGGRIKGDGWNE